MTFKNASPTALSSGYVAESDPSEEDPEEDPAEYPANGGDNDDDDDDKEEEEEDEEGEHLALVVSATFEIDEFAPKPTYTSPTYAEAPLGYRAAMIRSRAASPSPILSPRLRRARISV
ncbi:hypothetical protein Tco_0560731 [Tanacetum coccineum]